MSFFPPYLVAVIAAITPDLGNPSVMPISAAIGGFFMATLARVMRYDRDGLRKLTEDGAHYGFVAGATAYVIGLVTGLY